MKKIFGFLAISTVLFACEKTDNIRPKFESATINGASDNAVIETGGNFGFDFEVSDNEGLNFVTVEAKKGFSSEVNVDFAGNDLSYGNNFSLEGKKESGNGSVNYDGAASGTYHLEFNVVDGNDNKGIAKKINFVYQNNTPGSRPFWNIASITPSPNGKDIFINRGNPIVIDAVANSTADIKHIKVEMLRKGERVLVLKKELTGSADLSFDMADLKNEQGDVIPLLVPVTAPQGSMVLLVTATDVNNQSGVLYYNVVVGF